MSLEYWLEFFRAAKIEEDYVPKYAAIFVNERITPENVLLLNDYFLILMGIRCIGHVIMILDLINKKKEKLLPGPLQPENPISSCERLNLISCGSRVGNQKCANSPCSNSNSAWNTLCQQCSRDKLSRSLTEESLKKGRPVLGVEHSSEPAYNKSPKAEQASSVLQEKNEISEKTSEDQNLIQSSRKQRFSQSYNNYQQKYYSDDNKPKSEEKHIPPEQNLINRQYIEFDKPKDEEEHEERKRSQLKHNINNKTEKVPISKKPKKDRSLVYMMKYVKHRSFSMQLEIQAEMEAISQMRPLPPASKKSCLQGINCDPQSILNEFRTTNRRGLKVEFHTGDPDIKMVPIKPKPPHFHSWKNSKEKYLFPSFLRRDRCLSLLNPDELKELTCLFLRTPEECFEQWSTTL